MLHPFATSTSRTRNRWITIDYTGFLWRVGSMANMSRQSLGDGNFEENGRCADHDDARHDLKL
jgi:hypothetical protein